MPKLIKAIRLAIKNKNKNEEPKLILEPFALLVTVNQALNDFPLLK